MKVDRHGKLVGISQEEWKRQFSERLLSILKERGMSQSELARRSGVSVSRINDYIKTKSAPTIFAAVNMANALNVKVSDLICCDYFVHN